MNNNYKFSIIITCYNSLNYIANSVESALNQIMNNFEIIIVNDGSTDGTGEVVDSYVRQYRNIVRSFHQENRGPGAARNAGTSIARGEYFLFLDADDQLCRNALNVFSSNLKSYSIVPDYLYGGHYTVNQSGKVKLIDPMNKNIHPKFDFKQLIVGKGVSPTHGSIIIHKDCFKKVSYPETIKNNEDLVLFAHLFALYSGRSISDPVVYKYKRPNSLRSDKQAIIDALDKAPELLFNPAILPAEYFQFKNLYVAKRHLEKARILFKNNEYAEFRRAFRQAVQAHPGSVLKPRFLMRYFRSLSNQFFRT